MLLGERRLLRHHTIINDREDTMTVLVRLWAPPLVPTQRGSVLLEYSAMFRESSTRVKSQFSDFASLTSGKSSVAWTSRKCVEQLRNTTTSCLLDSVAHQKCRIRNQDVCYHKPIRTKSWLNSDRMAWDDNYCSTFPGSLTLLVPLCQRLKYLMVWWRILSDDELLDKQ